MISESWDVFTKRVLVEKHISSIMYKSGRDTAPSIAHMQLTWRRTSWSWEHHGTKY